MVSETPPFWWKKRSWQSLALYPVSLVYGHFAARAMRNAKRAPAGVPVLCVGNFTAGGAGKTPTVIALAKAAKSMGLMPGILSRGYGGSLDVTTIVDPHHHRARDVGDEPLLLAQEAMTVISRKRVDGAAALKKAGVDIIIMDDGFQSARIGIDYALLVIDGRRGIGNGLTLPAGPVRVPLKEQILHVTALLRVGSGDAPDRFVRQLSRAGKPVYEARVATSGDGRFAGRRFLAFAGIADPDKFYESLEAEGGEIAIKRSFADHQHLEADEVADLLNDAEREGLALVTTAKDHVRLAGGHGLSETLREKAEVLDIEMTFDDPAIATRIVADTIATFKRRRFKS